MGILLFFLSLQPAAQPASSPYSEPSGQTPSVADQPLTYKLIETNGKGFGYDIYVNKALYIHQPVIPGVPGNHGFKTRAEAKKVALLVISKIKKGINPPAVTVSELKKLGIDLR